MLFKESHWLRIKEIWRVEKDKSMDFIGCSVSELKKRLENKFLPGMTWDNYGKWHVDHIKPCASFDLSDENQQKSALVTLIFSHCGRATI